jgi:hydrogenase-4 component B
VTAALATGLALLLAAMLAGLARPRPGPPGPGESTHGSPADLAWAGGPLGFLPYLLAAAGAACLAAAGAGVLAGDRVRLSLGDLLGFGPTVLAADRLSGLFLVIAFGAAVPVMLLAGSRAPGPHGPRRGRLGAACALVLAALGVVITARDAFTLLFGWESLTVAFYLLAGFDRAAAGRPAGAIITLIFGKVSGVSLLAGLLLLTARSHSLALAGFVAVPAGGARTTAYVLLVFGFAVKAGVVPVQVWLPRGYAAAPAPARAVMAGVAVNAGFYGLWRTFALLGRPPGWLVGILLVLAALTAVLGIAHAAVQTSLPRVIAYSSVENTGLIMTGFGVALTGAAVGDQRLVAAGLLAATLQVIAHTIAKSLLFTCGATVEAAGGTDDLDGLRGAARRTPWSGTGFAIGALTLAGLPLTAGFVSEWFLLESLMQQFRVPGLGYRLVLAVAGAAVALTVGFAGVTFVRLTGLVVLGPAPATPRRPGGGREYGWLGRAGLAVMAAACLGAAALTPLEIRLIGSGLSPVVPERVTGGALAKPWVLGPVFPGFSVLSPSWLWIVMPALLVAVAGVTLLAARGRLLRVRRVPAWRSATAGVEGDQYTAFGYTNPTRRVLAGVLLTRTELHSIEEPADTGGEPGAAPVPHLGYTSDVLELVEEFGYRPLARPMMALVRAAKRLQAGRLDAYLAYMLIALIAILAVVTALG